VKVRRPVIAVLVAASSLCALAVPAGAAVPKTPPFKVVSCSADGEGPALSTPEPGHASVWSADSLETARNNFYVGLAAENPCSRWLVIEFGSMGLAVAPGAHFNWPQKMVSPVPFAQIMPGPGDTWGPQWKTPGYFVLDNPDRRYMGTVRSGKWHRKAPCDINRWVVFDYKHVFPAPPCP